MTEEKGPTKIISWNVNGLQGILKKDPSKPEKKFSKPVPNNRLSQLLEKENPDFLCLQEIRCSDKFQWKPFPFTYCSYSERKGRAGVLVSCKTEPLSVSRSLEGLTEEEGRVLILEFPNYYLLNLYCPNTGSGEKRHKYRIEVWEPALRKTVVSLQKKKSVVLVGDLNVIPEACDVDAWGKPLAGESKEEKEAFQLLLKEGNLTDTFRFLHPKKSKYSWSAPWMRKYDKGARIDFCLVSEVVKEKVKSSDILNHDGSDHVPLLITLAP